MRSSIFFAVLCATVVACSAEATGDKAPFADDEADGAAEHAPLYAGDAIDAHGDTSQGFGLSSDAGDSMIDAGQAPRDGKAGSSIPRDAAAEPRVADDAGSTAYDPCPASAAPCAVMPVGDSITFGVDATLGYNMSNGGYRTHLFDLAHRAGKALTFVGSQSNGPDSLDGVPFPKAHEGHPGWVIVQITDIIVSAMETYKPRIILLMIGTNDINAGFNPPDAPNRLGQLADKILATDPEVLLVIAKIIPTQSSSENLEVQTYNAAIDDLVAARIAARKHVALVDMYGALASGQTSSYMSDNLHPNDSGYAQMATTWFSAIGSALR